MPAVDSTAYIEIATEASVAQNRGTYRVRLFKGSALPTVSEAEYITLGPEQAYSFDGTDSLYAMCDKEGETVQVGVV